MLGHGAVICICTNFVIFYLNVSLIANFEKINRIGKEIENKKKKKHKDMLHNFIIGTVLYIFICTLHTPDIFLILLICLSFFTLQARDIYEEAIMTVITVRDFTQVFDAYAQFEKNLISSKMESMEETGASEEGR